MPKPRRPDPLDVVQLGATIGVGRSIRQLEANIMAQFDNLNTALDELSGSVDELVSRLESATVEDPAVQASIDEAVTRIKEVQSRIDAIGGEETPGEPPTAEQLPADTGPQVEHR